MRLCLGTVQFGMDYGVQNAGQPDMTDAVNIIETAVQNGVIAIDTASAYGTAEEVVGAFLKKHPSKRESIDIISKLPPDAAHSDVRESIKNSLQRLNTEQLDFYLLHNPSHIYDSDIVKALFALKNEGLTRHIGVSAYTPDEAVQGIELGFDALQIPYSVFDQRMDEQGVFDLAHRAGVELHVRSVFTQGLMLMDEQDVPEHLEKARPYIRKLARVCEEHNISRLQLAVSFVLRQERISYLVFGVDNKQQLMEIIEASKQAIPATVLDEAAKLFAGMDEDIILPTRWAK